jgi:hypothetical protein
VHTRVLAITYTCEYSVTMLSSVEIVQLKPLVLHIRTETPQDKGQGTHCSVCVVWKVQVLECWVLSVHGLAGGVIPFVRFVSGCLRSLQDHNIVDSLFSYR